MSSVASKLSNVPSEGTLVIRWKTVFHTHIHEHESAFSYTFVSIVP